MAALFKMASFFRVVNRKNPSPRLSPGSFGKTASPGDNAIRANLTAPHIQFPAILKGRI
jgi:hypothetical protein